MHGVSRTSSAVYAFERPLVCRDADGLAHETSPAECHASGRARVPHTGGWEWHILEIGDSGRRVTATCRTAAAGRAVERGVGRGGAAPSANRVTPVWERASPPNSGGWRGQRAVPTHLLTGIAGRTVGGPRAGAPRYSANSQQKSHGLGGGGAAWVQDQARHALSQMESCETTLANHARRPRRPTRHAAH